MANNDRDINFRLRAQDLTSRTMSEVTSASDRLTASIGKLVEQAKAGEVSTSLLNEVLRDMKSTQDQLSHQNSLVQQFRDQTQRVNELQAKLSEATSAQQAYRSAVAATGVEIDESDRKLVKLNNAVAGADRRLNVAVGTLGKISADLNRAGIDTQHLDTAQAHITQTFDASVLATKKLDDALTHYQRNLQETRTEQQRMAGDTTPVFSDQDAARFQEAATKRATEEYVQWWTNALNQVDARKAASARVQADEGQLAAFRAQATQAQQEIGSLSSAEMRAATSTNTLEAALRSLANPTEAVRGTMTGLIGEVDRLESVVGRLKGVTANYSGTARELADVQRALANQGALIDSYRRQEQQTKASAESLVYWRAQFDEYVRLVRSSNAPTDELAQSLNYAKTQVQQLTAEVQRDNSALDALSAKMRQAGVDVRNLAAAEGALRDSAQKAAVAQSRLSSATTGRGARGVQGIFGLKPYELQNLGFQVNDVFTQLASGASITQTLAQQGGQVLQIFPGLFSKLARGAVILAPAVAILGTYAAGINRLVDQEQALRRFTSLQAASADGSRYQAQALVDAQNGIKGYGTSFDEAGNAVARFMKDGVKPDQLVAFGKAARNVSDVFGTEFAQNAEAVSQAFTRGYKSVKEYDDQLNFLTASERDRIKALFESGDVETARGEAFRIFSDRMKTAAEQSNGPWTTAFRKIGGAIDALLDTLSKNFIVQAFTRAMNALAESVGNAADEISLWAGGTPMEKAQARLKGLTDELASLQRQSANPITPLPLGAITSGDLPTGGIPDRPDTQAVERTGKIRDIEIQRRDTLAEIRELQKGEVVSAEDAARIESDRLANAEAERLESEKSRKVGQDLIDQLALELGSKKLNDKQTRINSEGQKEFNRIIDAGGDAQSAKFAREMREAAVRKEIAKEEAQAAEQAANKAEAEANKRAAAAQRLINLERSLAAQSRKGDKTMAGLGVEDLDTKLTNIDQTFDDIIAKAKEFASIGGTNVRGQSIDEFIAETNQQREQIKNLETLQHYQDVANAQLTQRKDLVETYNNLVQLGLMTETDAQKKIQEAYAATNPLIKEQIDSATALLATLRDQGVITASVFDQISAKLMLVQSQMDYMSPTIVQIRDTVQSSIQNGVVTFFDNAAQSIAGLIQGTMTLTQALSSIGSTIANVASTFLREVGMMILKLYALKLAQSLVGMSGLGGAGGGDAISQASSLIGAGVYHSGADSVGSGNRTSRRVSPLAFVNAPRYHEGVKGLGLRSDERAAILQTGESVLARGEANPMFTSADDRPMNIRSVLVDDPNRIPEAMQSAAGEKIIVATVLRMVPTLRQQLSSK